MRTITLAAATTEGVLPAGAANTPQTGAIVVTTGPAQTRLEQTRASEHPCCIVCGRAGECGLDLRFRVRGDGGVEAEFTCPGRYQGYEGLLHGGVTCSLLDGAMTNCLFAQGIAAVTAEMTVRFRHPITVSRPLLVKARITRSQPPLHVVEAEIVQDDQVKARASGKFMKRGGAGGILSW